MHAEKLPAARGMSYEEFLDWCDEDTRRNGSMER